MKLMQNITIYDCNITVDTSHENLPFYSFHKQLVQNVRKAKKNNNFVFKTAFSVTANKKTLFCF